MILVGGVEVAAEAELPRRQLEAADERLQATLTAVRERFGGGALYPAGIARGGVAHGGRVLGKNREPDPDT